MSTEVNDGLNILNYLSFRISEDPETNRIRKAASRESELSPFEEKNRQKIHQKNMLTYHFTSMIDEMKKIRTQIFQNEIEKIPSEIFREIRDRKKNPSRSRFMRESRHRSDFKKIKEICTTYL